MRTKLKRALFGMMAGIMVANTPLTVLANYQPEALMSDETSDKKAPEAPETSEEQKENILEEKNLYQHFTDMSEEDRENTLAGLSDEESYELVVLLQYEYINTFSKTQSLELYKEVVDGYWKNIPELKTDEEKKDYESKLSDWQDTAFKYVDTEEKDASAYEKSLYKEKEYAKDLHQILKSYVEEKDDAEKQAESEEAYESLKTQIFSGGGINQDTSTDKKETLDSKDETSDTIVDDKESKGTDDSEGTEKKDETVETPDESKDEQEPEQKDEQKKDSEGESDHTTADNTDSSEETAEDLTLTKKELKSLMNSENFDVKKFMKREYESRNFYPIYAGIKSAKKESFLADRTPEELYQIMLMSKYTLLQQYVKYAGMTIEKSDMSDLTAYLSDYQMILEQQMGKGSTLSEEQKQQLETEALDVIAKADQLENIDSLTGYEEYLKQLDVKIDMTGLLDMFGKVDLTSEDTLLATVGDLLNYSYQLFGMEEEMNGEEVTPTPATTTKRRTRAKVATYATTPGVTYQAHVQSIGWMSSVSNGATGGTTGQHKAMEAFKLSLSNASSGDGITYRAYVKDNGWLGWVSNGAIGGTTGQSKTLQAFQIKLTGPIAQTYSVVYRAHVDNVGWQNWQADGATAGTTGQGLAVQAIQIMLVKKGEEVSVANGAYYIYAGDSNFLLDISNNGTVDKTNVDIWNAGQSGFGRCEQKWVILKQSDGWYKIMGNYSRKCLDLFGESNQSVQNINLYTDNGSASQRWKFYNYNGKYIIKNKRGTVLDFQNATLANGTNVQSYAQLNGTAQLWRLAKITNDTVYLKPSSSNGHGYTASAPTNNMHDAYQRLQYTGGTIQIMDNWNVTSNVTLTNNSYTNSSASSLSLLSGCTLGFKRYSGFTAARNMFYVTGGSLTLKNLVLDGNRANLSKVSAMICSTVPLTLDGCTMQNSSTYNDASFIVSDGNVNATNCNFKDNYSTRATQNHSIGGIWMEPNTVGTFTGCNFSGNTSNSAVLIYFSKGIFKKCTFKSNGVNKSSGYASALGSNAGDLELYDCDFEDNYAIYDGGAVHLNNNPGTSNDNNRGHFYAEGCSFTNNGCGGGGAAIMLCDTRQTATIKNCTFTNNKAGLYAGAIAAILQTKLILTGNKFIGNAVTGTNANGGAVYSDYSKTDTAITATNNTFDGNVTPTTGACSGGAVRVAKGIAEFDHNIWMNSKSVWGGAVDIQAAATATMEEESFSNNSSSNEGGAVHNNGTLTVNDGVFKGNSSVYGGAIFNNGSLDVKSNTNETTTAIFESNVAVNGGAIYSQAQSSGATYKFASTGIQYTGNKAIDSGATVSSNKNAGGAIYINNNTKNNTLKDNKYKSNSAYYGGAVHVAADATCTSSGETYVENSVNGGGGAFHSNGTSTITLGTFKKNMSSVGGGAIESAGITNISNSKLEENTADEGGAIHVCQVIDGTTITTKLTSTANDYISNAARKGGAIEVDTKSTVDSFNDNIQGCSATQIGGAFMSIATLSIYGGTIGNEIANTAGEKGGAVYHEGKVFNMSNDASIDKSNDVYLTPGKYITVPGILNKNFVARITPSDYTPGRTVVKNTYGVKGSTIEPKFTLTPKTGFFLKGGDTYSVTDNADVVISRNYPITYDANGGIGGPENQKKEWNVDTAISSKKPTQKGYVFEGWNTEEDGSGDDYFPEDDYTENEDLTLYAQWMPIKYTVAYNGNGSTSGSMSTQTFTYGKSYNLATNGFVRSGCHFAGWNTKADGSGTSYADKQSVKNLASTHGAKITLYAQWVKNNYTICFHANGGIGSMADVTVPYDTSYNLPTNKFTYQGYTFDKWKTEDGTSVYGNEAAIKYSSSQLKNGVLNLYAQWKINQYTLTITGDSGVEKTTGSGTYNYGTTANVTYQIKPGYHIKNITGTTADGDPNGVWTGHTGKGGTITDTWTVKACNRTIVVHTEPNTYTVKYDGNGNTGGSTASSSHTYDAAKALTANGYTKTGYSFNGWNTKADGSGTAYADKDSVKNLTTTNGGTVTLYAQWTAKKYTVAYNANGGSGTMAADTATYGSGYVTKANAFSRTGYTFKGWNEKADGTGTDWTNWIGKSWTWTYTKNITLYAQWTAKNVTVTFHRNTDNNDTTTSQQTFTYDVVGQKFTDKGWNKTGYTLLGWSTDKNATNASYSVTNGVSDEWINKNSPKVDLYGVWKANIYTVKYDGNGNTGGSTANSSHTYDTAKALTANGYTRTGYSFNGWNTKADGSGTAYADKASVKNLSSTNGATVTLYAQWIANKYTVTYNANGGSGTMETDKATYGAGYVTKENVFSRTGYTFVGWNEKADGAGTDWTSWIGKSWTWTYTKNITLYAQWTKNSYYLDLNGVLDGKSTGNITGYGTADIYVDGVQKANDVTDFYQKIPYGSKYEIKDIKVVTGHTYVGVHSGSITGTIGTSNVGVVLEFRTNKYTVAFDKNNGTGSMSGQSFTYGVAQALTANTYKRTGYTFKGWNTKADGSGTSYSDKQEVSNLSATDGATVTLYAQWTANKYTITVHPNSGTLTVGDTNIKSNADGTATITVTYGSTNFYNLGLTAAKTGYQTVGFYDNTSGGVKLWNNGGACLQDGKYWNRSNRWCYAGNVDVYPQWKANTYTVKYDGNGATGGLSASSSHTYDAAKALTANGYIRTGYTFKNWNTQADGKGVSYADKASVKNLTSVNGATVILYAQWTANKYTVAYNANGGTGMMANQELTYDKAATLNANTFKRAGYRFSGWNTKADGTGTSYVDKASVKNLTANSGGTVTLYAKWYSAVPELEAKDATYYEGQDITKTMLLKNVTKASDAEDGDMTGKVIITKIEYSAGKLVDGKPQAAYTKSWTNGMPDSEKLDTWFQQLPKEKAPVTHKITYQVTDLSGKTTTKTSTITVKYNEFPVIKAEDRYFTLEEAKSGKITKDVLLKEAIASGKLKAEDKEDGVISNKVTILDYKDTDFKNVNDNATVTVIFKVNDSMGPSGVGKETVCEVKVKIIDSGSDYWRDDDETARKQVRFITQKYYDKNKDTDFHGMTSEEIEASSDNGGLNVMSKWYQNAAYKALLTGSFAKDAGTDYKISAEKTKELKQKIESNGIGNSKSSNALTDIYNSLK